MEQVASRVVAQIETALHPELVALLVREPDAASFRSVAAAPAGQAPPPLAADSKLMSLMRVLGKAMELPSEESGWLLQQLPPEEIDYLRPVRIDLLVPIASERGRREAVLALGVKRSEEPYAREDQDLLVAIAASLALLFERSRAAIPAPVSEGFDAPNVVSATTLARGNARRTARLSCRYTYLACWQGVIDSSADWDAAGWARCMRLPTGRWAGAWP